MSSAMVIRRPLVLADVVPGARVRDAVLVCAGGAAHGGGRAGLDPTSRPPPSPSRARPSRSSWPAPRSGPSAAGPPSSSTVMLGLALPVYSDGASGPDARFGATGGSLVGFVLAATVVGWPAERGADRRAAPRVRGRAVRGVRPRRALAQARARPALVRGDPLRIHHLHRRGPHQGGGPPGSSRPPRGASRVAAHLEPVFRERSDLLGSTIRPVASCVISGTQHGGVAR
jgi:hypothetical protein